MIAQFAFADIGTTARSLVILCKQNTLRAGFPNRPEATNSTGAKVSAVVSQSPLELRTEKSSFSNRVKVGNCTVG